MEHIKKEVFNFLQSDSPEVIVIKGSWGTGKTYTWQEWLLEAIDDHKVAVKKYAYVSLFGCTSLDQLKAQIFEETDDIDEVIEEKDNDLLGDIKSRIQNTDWKSKVQGFVTKIDKYTKFSKNLPYVSIDLGHLGWLSVKETLICIDDIERHGEGLDTKDIYGLISVLKEQRNCKIVLILNDEGIEDDNKKVYELYREKVVDVELHFDPETEELIKLIFDPKEPHYKKIMLCIQALGTKNVRTIQKIKRYIDIINPHIDKLPDNQKENVINSIVLFTILFFSRPDKWPSLDEVLEADTEKFTLVHWVDDEEKARTHNVDLKWIQKLSVIKDNYEWAGSDEIDQVLGRFVKQGYLDVQELSVLTEERIKNSEAEENKLEVRKLHHLVGEVLHESMDDNFDELIKVMKKSLDKSVKIFPSVAHLNQYVTILRNLEADDEANELIDYYINKAKKKGSEYLTLSSTDYSFAGPLDSVLEQGLNEAAKKALKTETKKMLKQIDRREKIQDLVSKSYERRFTDDDLKTVSLFNESDFEDFFKSTKIDRNAHSFISMCLHEYKQHDHLREEYTRLNALIQKVVKKLAENRMNKYRLKRHTDVIEQLEEEETEEKSKQGKAA